MVQVLIALFLALYLPVRVYSTQLNVKYNAKDYTY